MNQEVLEGDINKGKKHLVNVLFYHFRIFSQFLLEIIIGVLESGGYRSWKNSTISQ